MKSLLLVLVLTLIGGRSAGQTDTLLTVGDTLNGKRLKVYNTKPILNIPIIAGGFVTNYFGIQKLKSKPGLDSAEVVLLTPEDINSFDRGAAMQDPAIAKKSMFYSDIALNTCILSPLVLLFDDKIRQDALQIGVIYLTTEAIMANAYSWGVGHLNRKRPYVYNPRESIGRRTRKGSFNSFYGGHTAAAASCSFFLTKIYTDYNPNVKRKALLYGAALIPPTIVAYFRHKAGMHFPSDNIAGMAGGAFLGFIVPHLHKNRKLSDAVSLHPFMGEYSGFRLTWNLGTSKPGVAAVPPQQGE